MLIYKICNCDSKFRSFDCKKINNDIYIDVTEIDINSVDELYSLKIDGEIRYISQSIISLLYLVVDNKYTDWLIFNLK